MNIIFSILLVFFIILLLAISSAWLESYQQKHKVKFAETIIDKVCSLIDSKLELMTDQSRLVLGISWFTPRIATIRYGSLTTISAAYIPTQRSAESPSSSSMARI